jgi:hypothetical protein
MSLPQTPEAVLADTLTASPAVARLLGFRVYPVLAPEAASLPFCTWRRVSIQRESALSGPTGVVNVTMALECYAATYEAVRELADACRASLDGCPVRRNTAVGVRNVSLLGENDGIVTLAGGEAPPVYSVTQTYSILWGPE